MAGGPVCRKLDDIKERFTLCGSNKDEDRDIF